MLSVPLSPLCLLSFWAFAMLQSEYAAGVSHGTYYGFYFEDNYFALAIDSRQRTDTTTSHSFRDDICKANDNHAGILPRRARPYKPQTRKPLEESAQIHAHLAPP